MPDDRTASWRDSERVDLDEETALKGWSVKLGVTRRRLREAVQAVGDDATRVKQHLRADERPNGGGRGER
jgi:hypothetical protein